MYYVIAFDISNDRVRYRAVKTIKGFGYRVQKSVFECPDITEKQLLTLKDTLEGLIDQRSDSVRYFRLCRACLQEIEWSGLGRAPITDNFMVL